MECHVRYAGDFRWEGIDVHAYGAEGTHFRDVTRQVLFGGDAGGASELRYFEVQPDGHTALERHEHAHEVMILRGRGRALAGDRIVEIRPFDLLRIPPMAWHQLRASPGETLGFLCLVDRERDRPQRPTREQIVALRSDPEIGLFIRV